MASSNVIGFYLQLNDQMTAPLASIERGYNRVTSAIDKMNASVQGKSNRTVNALENLTKQLEALPRRITKAARDMDAAMSRVAPSGRTGRGRGRDISSSIARGIERALKNVSIDLKTGKFQGFAKGGEVTGGVKGRDSVPAMLTPGEVVLPVDVVQQLRGLFGRVGGPGFAKGGTVGSSDGVEFSSEDREVFSRMIDGLTETATSIIELKAMYGSAGPYAHMQQALNSTNFAYEQQAGLHMLALDAMSDLDGRMGTLIRGWVSFDKLIYGIKTLKKAIYAVPKAFKRMTDTIRERLGLREDQSLISGAAKVTIAGATAAAISVEDDWMKLRKEISLTRDQFTQAKEIGYDAMATFGASAEDAFEVMRIGAGVQKRSGENLAEFTKQVHTYSHATGLGTDATADMIWNLERAGIASERVTKSLSAMAYVQDHTTLTTDQMASGIETVTDKLLILNKTSQEAEDFTARLNASAGLVADNWGDATQIYGMFDTLLGDSLEDIQSTNNLLATMSYYTGQSQQALAAMSRERPDEFMQNFAQAIKAVPNEQISFLKSQLSDFGVDEKTIAAMRRITDPSGFTALGQAAASAGQEGTYMAEKYAMIASTFAEMWGKMKQAFYTFFIQIGEPFMEIIRPFFNVFVGGLQWAARLLVAMPKPIKYAVAGLLTLVATFSTFLGLLKLYGTAKFIIGAWSKFNGAMAEAGIGMDVLVGKTWDFIKATKKAGATTLLNTMRWFGLGESAEKASGFIGKATSSVSEWLKTAAEGGGIIGGLGDGLKFMTESFFKVSQAQTMNEALSISWTQTTEGASRAVKVLTAWKWADFKATIANTKATIVDLAVRAKEAVMDKLELYSFKAKMLAMSLRTAMEEKDLKARISGMAIKAKDTVLTWLGVGATTAETGAQQASMWARISATAAAIKDNIVTGISTGLKYAQAAAAWVASSGFYALAAGIWAALAPLLPFIAIGAAVIGVFYLLYKAIDYVVTELFGFAGVWDMVGAAISGVWSILSTIGKAIFNVIVAPYVLAWKIIKGIFTVYTTYLKGFYAGFMEAIGPALGELRKAWSSVVKAVKAIFAPFSKVSDIASDSGESFDLLATALSAVAWVGETVGWVFGSLVVPQIQAVAWLVGLLADAIGLITPGLRGLYRAFVTPFQAVYGIIEGVYDLIVAIASGDGILDALGKLGNSIFELMTLPFQMAFNYIAGIFGSGLKIGDLIGKVISGIGNMIWEAIAGIKNWILGAIDKYVLMPLSGWFTKTGGPLVGSQIKPVSWLGSEFVDLGLKTATLIPATPMAEGGVIEKPTLVYAGEAGREAITPLTGDTIVDTSSLEALLVQVRDAIINGNRGRRRPGGTDPLSSALLTGFDVV